MKRILPALVALTLCGVGSLLADDNVRALQNKLKDGGFYFGEANGTYESETAAAVTRYQIRNGLPISGRVDPETAKSLGVSTMAGNSTAPSSGADTWRRLRKTDQQFLTKINAGKPAPVEKNARIEPRPEPVNASSPSQVPAPAPATPDAPSNSTFTLSRERLRDYIAAYVLAGLDAQVGAELEFFADRVRYFDSGVVDREKIRRDLQRYDSRWPQRRFWLAGEIQIQPPQADGLLRVTFPLRFELQNQSKRKSGRVQKNLALQIRGEDLEIVSVNEHKA